MLVKKGLKFQSRYLASTTITKQGTRDTKRRKDEEQTMAKQTPHMNPPIAQAKKNYGRGTALEGSVEKLLGT